ILVVNMFGDFANVFFRGDGRALVGLPIAGILTAYLMSDRAKRGEPVQESPAEAEPVEPEAMREDQAG
ncbi:MAG TPA: hypothetical protein VFD83_04635, partial [Candidatus Polarisedimenticolia bacterium]|nr:hypothetical protein [Candidatus Polarisedimenticolia bacterium]